MKRNKLLCIAAAGLVLGLAGCGSASSAPGSTPGSSQSPSAAPGGYKTGLGVSVQATAAGPDAAVEITMAAVLLDEEGRIHRVTVDAADHTGSAAPDGTLVLSGDSPTRREEATAGGRDWAQQADAFCACVTGKTAAEVSALAVDEAGMPLDAELAAVCTIPVEELLAATAKACEAAAALGAGQADGLTLGVVTTDSGSRAATDDADGVIKLTSTIVAMTKDTAGRVTSAVCDMAELTFPVASDGQLTPPAELRTKLQQGSDYGMKTASQSVGIGKEWYEQSAGFCQYLTGRTAGQIAGIPADGSDADLAARCTVDMTEMLAAALKAAQ